MLDIDNDNRSALVIDNCNHSALDIDNDNHRVLDMDIGIEFDTKPINKKTRVFDI